MKEQQITSHRNQELKRTYQRVYDWVKMIQPKDKLQDYLIAIEQSDIRPRFKLQAKKLIRKRYKEVILKKKRFDFRLHILKSDLNTFVDWWNNEEKIIKNVMFESRSLFVFFVKKSKNGYSKSLNPYETKHIPVQNKSNKSQKLQFLLRKPTALAWGSSQVIEKSDLT